MISHELFSNFNPRSYKRSDLSSFARLSNTSGFQSTLLQEERRRRPLSSLHTFPISIHAPTRGATNCFHNWHNLFIISIHAPTRGATCARCKSVVCIFISIHAPTRGATKSNPMLLKPEINISIHAPTRGATAKMHNIPYASLQ